MLLFFAHFGYFAFMAILISCFGLFVVLIALLTVGFQSIKAALAYPVKSLRSE